MSERVRMQRALDIAMLGTQTCAPNPMVGCVIVKDDDSVHEGWHKKTGEAHAETIALGKAGDGAKDAVMYVNLEPCAHHGNTPPCVEKIISAGIKKVHVAMEDPDPRVRGRGIEKLRAANIQCEVGLLEEEAAWLNRGFVSRVTRNRPWVCLKTASSLDGRIALEGGGGTITGSRARRIVHHMRADSCAIMTGSGTALADNPMLTARDVNAARQPIRFLVDSRSSCPASLRMFEGGGVLATATKPPKNLGGDVEVLLLDDGNGKVDLERLLGLMSERWKVNSLMVEAGAGLAGALLSRSLVDEIAAFVAPAYLGAGMSVCDFAGVDGMDKAPRYATRHVRTAGNDVLISLVKDRGG